ncbi:MAG: MATE family efflux transporter [Candidatus Aenigmatarchaeota archaeon]
MNNTKIMERREKILNDDIVKTLLTLAWPVMLGNTLHTAYNLADTFWLGKVGKEAVAASATSWPIIFLFISIGMGLSTAGVSLVSQYIGSNDHRKANKAAGQVLGLIFIISVITAVVGFFSSEWILRVVVGSPDEVLPLATTYLQIITLSLPVVFSFISFRFILRGIGDMITPMYILGTGVVLNAILDPLLIMGYGPFPAMGVAGAALATAITRIIASALGFYLLFSKKLDIILKLKDFKPEINWVKKIINISGPATIARAGSALGFVAMITLVSKFGTVAVSAYGIGSKVIQLVNITTWGFAGSTLTMVGQNIGAGNKERAEVIVKKSMLVAFVIMFIIAILVYFTRADIVSVFINNPNVVFEGSRFLAIFVFAIPFFGVFRILDSTYRGTGHTKSAMVLSLSRLWILRVGLSYLLAFSVMGIGFKLGIVGIWWGMAIGNVIASGVSYIWFSIGKWKKKTIDEEDEQNVALK